MIFSKNQLPDVKKPKNYFTDFSEASLGSPLKWIYHSGRLIVQKLRHLFIQNALNDSEKKYQLLVENSSDIIYSVNVHGNFIYVNPVAEEILGWPRAEIVGQHYLSIITPEFREKTADFYQKQFDECIPNTYFELPIISRDGTTKWFGQNVQLLTNNGKRVCFQAVVRDITARKKAVDALQESETKYKFLAEKMTDVVWVMDLNLRTTYVSPSIEAMLGFTTEERIAQRIEEQLTPDSLSIAFDRLAQELALEQEGKVDPQRTLTIELEYYHKDGSKCWIENIISGIRDEKGVLTGLHGVSRNISARKEIEEALKDSERKYRELVDFLPIPLFEIDTEGKMISANPVLMETFGYKKQDFVVGVNAFQTFIPQDMKRMKINMERVLRGEKISGSEYTGIRKDGSTFPIIIFSSPIVRMGKAEGLRGAIIDITDRKRVEESLQKSNLSLAAAQRIAHIGNWEWDIKSDIMYWSDEMYRITGRNLGEFDGTYEGLLAVIHGEDRNKLMKSVAQVVNKGVKIEVEHRILRCDESVREVCHRLEPIYSDKENIVKVIGIVQDITDQNQKERDLQKARELLMQSEKLAAIGRLSAGVAHEILNPVNIISMGLQILQTIDDLPAEALEEVNICRKQIRRIVAITDHLKQLSSTPRKKITTDGINKVLADILKIYDSQLSIEGVEIEVDYGADLPDIKMDREKIEQVILNLIANATAAMKGKKKKILQIKTGMEELIKGYKRQKIMIADTGTGIENEHMSKIFDPFFTTKEPGKGTGLGLSISYGIIRDHGGRIWAENNEMGGASFYISLPVKVDSGRKALTN